MKKTVWYLDCFCPGSLGNWKEFPVNSYSCTSLEILIQKAEDLLILKDTTGITMIQIGLESKGLNVMEVEDPSENPVRPKRKF